MTASVSAVSFLICKSVLLLYYHNVARLYLVGELRTFPVYRKHNSACGIFNINICSFKQVYKHIRSFALLFGKISRNAVEDYGYKIPLLRCLYILSRLHSRCALSGSGGLYRFRRRAFIKAQYIPVTKNIAFGLFLAVYLYGCGLRISAVLHKERSERSCVVYIYIVKRLYLIVLADFFSVCVGTFSGYRIFTAEYDAYP